MQPQLIPLTDIASLKTAGLPWKTVDQVRWAFRKRHENGLADAFRRQGKTILVIPERAHELIRSQPAA